MNTCEVCGSHEFHRKEVEEIFRIDEHYVLVEHIPATVCARCGEKTFDATTADHIRQMLHTRNQPIRSVAMDVFAAQGCHPG